MIPRTMRPSCDSPPNWSSPKRLGYNPTLDGAASGGRSGCQLDALDYRELLAETKVDTLPSAALRWHGRFELEATTLTIAGSQLALSALGAL
jgi:hypothetical protein